jgi:signal peptidase
MAKAAQHHQPVIHNEDNGKKKNQRSVAETSSVLLSSRFRLLYPSAPQTLGLPPRLKLPVDLYETKYNGTMIKEVMDKQIYELKKLWANKRQLTFQVLNLAMIVFSALMIWKGLMFVTLSESPVVVVLSGSMEPAFQRGDILFLNNAVHDVHVGDVVVFKIKDRDIPIVHRILKVHLNEETGEVDLLTKGDNNRVDDRGLYAPGQLWLSRDDILGRAVGTLRYVGMVTIALNDYPVLKYVLVGMMGLFVLTSKEG